MASGKEMKIRQVDLQKLVGSSPKITIEKFTNWATTQVLEPILACTPISVEEVQAVIRGAKQLGLRVRAAGTKHSWSSLFADVGHVVMYMRELKRSDGPQIELLKDDDNPGKQFVTMASGVTSGEFLEFQISHGICIPSNVVPRVLQFGGIISAACHGVGRDVQSISDCVVSLSIVNSNGDLKHYSLNEDQDMMRAIQCSLGLWGIVVEITMKVDPMVIVETDNQWIPMKDIFYNKEALHKLITENGSVEIVWFPFNGISAWEAFEAFMEKEIDCHDWDPKEDEVWVRVVNKSDKTGELLDKKDYKRLDFQSWIQAKGYQLVDGFVKKFPQAAPAFLKSQFSSLKDQHGGKVAQHLPYAIHYLDNLEATPMSDMEWSFSVDEDSSNLCTAIQGVVDLVHKEALAGRFPMNLPLEMRFIADSDAYMAPAVCGNKAYGGSGHTCCINILAVPDTPGFYEFGTQVADIWKSLPGARPHWCKEWEWLPGIEEFIRKAFADQMPKFLSALERSHADPEGMFFNKRLEGIFYPAGHPGTLLVATRSKGIKSDSSRKGEGNEGGDKPKNSGTCHIF